MASAEQLTVEDELIMLQIDMLKGKDKLQQSLAKNRDLEKSQGANGGAE